MKSEKKEKRNKHSGYSTILTIKRRDAKIRKDECLTPVQKSDIIKSSLSFFSLSKSKHYGTFFQPCVTFYKKHSRGRKEKNKEYNMLIPLV
jgi:hypothetical protein